MNELYGVNDTEYTVLHYGRKGMKWYQNIFGRPQSHAKYATRPGNSGANNKPVKQEPELERYKKKKNIKKDIKTGRIRTVDQLNRALAEYEAQRRLRQLTTKNVDDIRNLVGTVADLGTKTVSIYNTYGAVKAHFDDSFEFKPIKTQNQNPNQNQNKNQNYKK